MTGLRRLAGVALLAGLIGPIAPIAATGAAPGTGPAPPQPVESVCSHSGVVVSAVLAADARDACAGARDALDFFSTLGVAPTERLQIEIVPRLPEAAGPTAVGCYLEASRRILLVPYAEFRRSRSWFKQPIDRTLYRSLAAHETAHAVAACAFGIAKPTIQAKEYLAYVAMLATMPGALRERVLKAYPDAAFADDDRITAVFYMFEPMAFGVASWRHYSQAGKGPAFLKAVLSGRALTD